MLIYLGDLFLIISTVFKVVPSHSHSPQSDMSQSNGRAGPFMSVSCQSVRARERWLVRSATSGSKSFHPSKPRQKMHADSDG